MALLKFNGTSTADTAPPIAPPMTLAECQEADAALGRAADAYVADLFEQERLAREQEIDRLVRDSLEKRYAPQLIECATKVPRTRQSYIATFKHFKSFCADVNVTSLPARAGTVAAYLHQHILDGASPEKIRRLVAAVSYAHRIKEFFDPTEDELVRAIVYSTTKAKRGTANGKER
jgi:hypothetical protein